MSISRSEAFDLGFALAHRIQSYYDSRDISRVLTCEDFPLEIQALAGKMNGYRTKYEGLSEAMNLIHQVLQNEDIQLS